MHQLLPDVGVVQTTGLILCGTQLNCNKIDKWIEANGTTVAQLKLYDCNLFPTFVFHSVHKEITERSFALGRIIHK